jgi:Uma2 family endonuclease
MTAYSAEPPCARKWTRAEYHRAAEVGLFRPDERLELLEGEIIWKMSPQSDPHAAGVSLAADALREIFTRSYHVREEKPLVLSDSSEPEPDIVVVRGSLRATPRHPTPENTVLVMEVSETSLAYDRTVKAAAYAGSGLQEYWILNLRQRQLEIRRDPGLVGIDEYGYRFLQLIMADGEAAPLEAPDRPIQILDMLPSDMAATELD